VELNFGTQLEGPFLLAENGAVRAKVIGQLGESISSILPSGL